MKHPKIAQAFRTLRKLGYFAQQNLMCRIPDDRREKVVFYHSQDRERFLETGNLWLSWSGDGLEIITVFSDAGLYVDWDGSPDTRILIREVPE